MYKIYEARKSPKHVTIPGFVYSDHQIMTIAPRHRRTQSTESNIVHVQGVGNDMQPDIPFPGSVPFITSQHVTLGCTSLGAGGWTGRDAWGSRFCYICEVSQKPGLSHPWKQQRPRLPSGACRPSKASRKAESSIMISLQRGCWSPFQPASCRDRHLLRTNEGLRQKAWEILGNLMRKG